jgi:hypothetical protein
MGYTVFIKTGKIVYASMKCNVCMSVVFLSLLLAFVMFGKIRFISAVMVEITTAINEQGK